MSLLTDLRKWWAKESLPYNHNLPILRSALPKMPPVSPPRVERSAGASLQVMIDEIADLQARITELKAELEKEREEKTAARRQAARMERRAEGLRKDWPKIHQSYFTAAGVKALAEKRGVIPTTKRKK